MAAQVPGPPLVEAAKSGDAAKVRALLAAHADPNSAAKDGSTALMWAVQKDHLEAAQLLLQAGANAQAMNRYGAAAIALACTSGNAAMVEALLNAGVEANSASQEGETALMTCARAGSLGAVQVLLKHGADVNAKENWRGQTALMWAAAEGHAAVVKALLSAGADAHARAKAPPPRGGGESGAPARRRNAADFTPLLFAVREGQIETVRTLLDAGGDPNEALADGQSALHLAVMNANYDIGLLLLDRGANPNASACGWTALHQIAWTRRPNIHKTPAAIGSGKLESLEFTKILVSRGADVNARETREPIDGNLGKLKRVGATAFLLAAKSGDYEYMRFLAGLGADARLMTSEHITALETAAGIGIYRVAESPGSNEDAMECVKAAYELAHGDAAWVNHIDDNGRTALHGAAFRGSPEIVQYLYDRGAGATINRKDFLGWTALTIAEGVMWPTVLKTELPTAALLVKLGAMHEDVPEEVRMLGMATQGVDNGLDQTMGAGGGEAPPPPPKPIAPNPASTTGQR
jgi:ankyrin repeat protein